MVDSMLQKHFPVSMFLRFTVQMFKCFQINLSVEPGSPAKLVSVEAPGTPTVSNTKSQASRMLIRHMLLELRVKFPQQIFGKICHSDLCKNKTGWKWYAPCIDTKTYVALRIFCKSLKFWPNMYLYMCVCGGGGEGEGGDFFKHLCHH